MAGSASQTRGLLRDRAVRRVVGADLASLVGTFMVLAAMPFAVLSIGGSAVWVAVVLAAQGLSLAAFLPIGGVLGDRLPRKSVMIAADLLRLGSQGVLAVFLLTGSATLWQLVAAQVIHGIGTGLFMPAASAIVPDAVRGDAVQGTNALKVMATSVAGAVGPALGAAAVALSGAGLAMAADGATFAASAALLRGLDVCERDRPQDSGVGLFAELWRWGDELWEGWREFRTLRWMRWVTLEFTLVNAAVVAPFFVIGPAASEEWFGGAGGWAVILVGLAVGQFVGGAVGMKWRPDRPLLAGTLAFGLWAVPLVVLASQAPLGFVAAATFAGGIGQAMFAVLWDTTVQTQVREEARSRLSSFEQFGSLALVPFGYLLGGWAVQTVGTTAGLLGGVAILVVASICVLAAPSVRQLRSVEAPPGGSSWRGDVWPAGSGAARAVSRERVETVATTGDAA